MKKKFLNGFLLVVLIFIWGAVIYKYFGFDINSTNKTDELSNMPEKSFTKAISSPTDSFEPKLKIINPFKVSQPLKFEKEDTEEYKLSLNLRSTLSISSNVVWPSIKYYGFVKSEQYDSKLIVFSINGKMYREREKTEILGFSLFKATQDSLIMIRGKERKSFGKS